MKTGKIKSIIQELRLMKKKKKSKVTISLYILAFLFKILQHLH